MQIIANEFAAVEVTVDAEGHDKRLCLHDLSTGRKIMLDALVLSALASLPPERLEILLDMPAR